MSNYTRGRALEYRVLTALQKQGWQTTRAAGSKGCADVWAAKTATGVAWHGTAQLLLVSVKIPVGPLPPRERASLLRAAEVTGGIPLHVHPTVHRGELFWRRLTGQAPDAWEQWTP